MVLQIAVEAFVTDSIKSLPNLYTEEVFPGETRLTTILLRDV